MTLNLQWFCEDMSCLIPQFSNPQILQSPITQFPYNYLIDYLGSVVAITDNQGNLISQQRYVSTMLNTSLPFGGVRTNVTSPNSPNTDG